MRVGVYIDAFNLYFGGRRLCGGSTTGWRWLDVRALAQDLISRRQDWPNATIERVVYCTAMIDQATNATGHQEQDTYIRALRTGIVDRVEFGHYVARVKRAPLATEDPVTHSPVLTTSRWPVNVRNAAGTDIPNATFMVSYAFREEKGSDVNVASHLLVDTLENNIDAAIVISNDSDLALPLREARARIPVGTVNPSPSHLAGRLRGQRTDGVGDHWWLQLRAADLQNHQLPNPCGAFAKPYAW